MKPKPKDHGPTLEKTQQDHLIFSAVTSPKLPLCCVILKKNKTTTKTRKLFFWKF